MPTVDAAREPDVDVPGRKRLYTDVDGAMRVRNGERERDCESERRVELADT